MIVRDLDYYVDILKKKYWSKVKRSDIKDILQYGLNRFFVENKKGNDTYHYGDNYVAYCGKKFHDYKTYRGYQLQKISYRAYQKHKKEDFSGVYYFGVTNDDVMKNNNTYWDLEMKNINFYIFNENLFAMKKFKYYFKTNVDEESGIMFTLDKFKLTKDNSELIAYKDENNKLIMVEDGEGRSDR